MNLTNVQYKNDQGSAGDYLELTFNISLEGNGFLRGHCFGRGPLLPAVLSLHIIEHHFRQHFSPLDLRPENVLLKSLGHLRDGAGANQFRLIFSRSFDKIGEFASSLSIRVGTKDISVFRWKELVCLELRAAPPFTKRMDPPVLPGSYGNADHGREHIYPELVDLGGAFRVLERYQILGETVLLGHLRMNQPYPFMYREAGFQLCHIYGKLFRDVFLLPSKLGILESSDETTWDAPKARIDHCLIFFRGIEDRLFLFDIYFHDVNGRTLEKHCHVGMTQATASVLQGSSLT